jgi:cytosine/uracil/thiamine/allantoin permease
MRIILVVTLVLACTWLAINVALGALIAPALFSHAPPHADLLSRAIAGELFGDVLKRWIAFSNSSVLWLTVLPLAVLSGYALRDRNRLACGACMAAGAALIIIHLYSYQVVAEAWDVRPPAREADQAAYSDEKRAAFNALHARSFSLFLAETGVLFAIVLGASAVLARRQEALRPSAADVAR